jgi:Ni/Co efflux regulator RcnB
LPDIVFGRDRFVRDYWIGDFIMFALMSPPDGYVWVRVGDDALLVDADTGEVVQVVYDVFYWSFRS